MNSGGHSNAGGLFIESALLQVRLQDFEQKYKLLAIFMQQYFQTFIESLARRVYLYNCHKCSYYLYCDGKPLQISIN